MADRIEVAQAYVTIIPSLKGAQGTIAKELGAEKIGTDAGKQMGGGIIASIKDIAIGSALGNLIYDGLGKALDGAKQLFSDAFEGIADYQQNVGGIQKLYGNMGQSLEEYAASVGKSTAEVQGEWTSLENAQSTVLKNAQNAYKTTGMSANQYMQTATSFSAALINSLGGDSEAAAAQTQVAMQAISDNWNTFGGDLGMIQGAFQGFAKQNYTMLDNLKLGYGGTKTEMQRLIADANEYAAATGRASDMSIESFSDVVTAIQLIQEKQSIAGTTAREATETISGSLGMLNAAWANWLTSLGDSTADMGAQTQAVVESLAAVASNVVPIVIQMGTSAIQAIPQLIASAFEAIKTSVVPAIDNLTGGMATKFLEGFGRITQHLAPVGEAFQIVFGKVQEIVAKISPSLGTLANGAMKVLEGAARAIGWAFEALQPVISFAADLFGGVLKNAIDGVSGVLNLLGDIINGIADIVRPVAEGITEAFQDVAEKIEPVISGIGGLVSGMGDFFRDPLKAVGDFVTGANKDMGQLQKQTKTTFDNVGKTVKSTTAGIAKNAKTDMGQMSSAVDLSSQKANTALQRAYNDMQKAAQSGNEQLYQNAKTKFDLIQSQVNQSMTAASTSTASATKNMQSSINSLQGKTVELGAKNALGNTVEVVQGAINKLTGKTAELNAAKAKGFDSVISKAQEAINGIKGRTGGNAVKIEINAFKSGVSAIDINARNTSNGGKRWEVIPQYTATGGITTGTALTFVGEGRYSEAILPLSPQGMRPFAQAMLQEMGGTQAQVLITGNTFNVRNDNDIDAIANALAAKVSRANGGRL